jgi:hypothetical protein
MSRVHLMTASRRGSRYWDRRAHWDLNAMIAAAGRDRCGIHSLVNRPEDADLILFVETSTCGGPYFELVRKSRAYREHRDRCYVYCATDLIVPLVPGIFPSVTKETYLPAWTRAGGYIGIYERDELKFDPDRRPTELFSFMGASSTHPVRAEVMRLTHPEGLLLDTSSEQGPALPKLEYRRRYRDALLDSAFILCPRGGGPTTFRLMEAMFMGRVPVVISDSWVAPTGPDWNSFSIQVPEDAVERIPELLEARRPEAAAMGAMARQEWLEWFGPETAFHRTIEWTLELQSAAPERRGLRRLRPDLRAALPYHLLRRVRYRSRPRNDEEPTTGPNDPTPSDWS